MYVQTRKIKPTRRSVSGIFAFRALDSIPFESTLERDFLYRAEFDQRVTKIIPQPTKIPFVSSNGRSYTYTPDFLVYYSNRNPLLVEVKPREEIQENWSKFKHKFKFGLRYAKERDWDFRIYDESRIRGQALANIKFLQPYKRTDVAPELTEAVVKSLQLFGPMSIHDLLVQNNLSSDSLFDEAQLWHLLSTKLLVCDMDQLLTEHTVVWTTQLIAS
ncbi:MAG: TnsA endonuclease N-terminal domain-containing protein [Methylicorpusculum sp.]|uniref:TnsA endonuclease N-terminal domain-containing protein n=1 Tax=Methylicorpusculum sp. TaxID=2713644 RepID=UPI00273217E4|nr:TnsA endonuclease N-terminal domain-containing protein [Methylicorpusculum sp.]MDP2200837.1 TnsA endonuclease N-terminal domain-containing protein [Methylicorpusculum sp.]